jgi:hypothetical protein
VHTLLWSREEIPGGWQKRGQEEISRKGRRLLVTDISKKDGAFHLLIKSFIGLF